MTQIDVEEKPMKKNRGPEALKNPSMPFKSQVQVTPVFESASANILEIAEKGYDAAGVSLSENGLLVEMPKNAAIPALVRVEFKLKKWETISVYAKWTRQGHLFDFNFLIITPDDQARIQTHLNA